MGALKKLGFLGLSALALNFGINTCMTKSINNKQEKLKEQVQQVREFVSDDRAIKIQLDDIEDIDPVNYKILQPFWKLKKYDSLVENRFRRLAYTLQENTNRPVHIGLGLEWQDRTTFLEAVANANIILNKYGLYAKIEEVVPIELPNSFNDSDFEHGLKHSFDNPHDYYFVWTDSDYSSDDGKDDYAVKVRTKERMSLIDNDFKEKNLDKLIAQEILRLFTDKKNTTIGNKDKDYYSKIDVADVAKNIAKKFKDKPYDVTQNLEKERILRINVGIDGTFEKDAKEIIKKASKIYEKEFNIKFEIVDIYKSKLPDSWETLPAMKELKKRATKSSDIYLLFTDRDWDDETTGEGRSLLGQAHSGYGYTWIETGDNNNLAAEVVIHEIGHLFEAHHIYHMDGVMHPSNSDNFHWTARSREDILKHKFRYWPWSE
ncbi:MAG: hypothetical protein L6408_03020 [Nanoarchaeota archaeon]|nr:hypothetical protein [Nanoarchaeota archaeon]